ncbi:MAG: hypothetical protein ABI718_10605 [Acidobacteriota bacterium]
MRRVSKLSLFLLLALSAACGKEEVKPLSQYESANVQARAFNFQVYPGAKFQENQTDILRRAHFVLQPAATEAPPMAVYVTADPVEKVAAFYADKYGYKIADNLSNDFSAAKPQAYFLTGDIGKDAEAIKPVADKLNLKLDPAKAKGEYRGAFFAPQASLPRVSLQRPYLDLHSGDVIDKTLIVMVRE